MQLINERVRKMATIAGVFPSSISRFNNLSTAKSFLKHCVIDMDILNGCDGLFWVVNWRDAQKLIKAGYELAL